VTILGLRLLAQFLGATHVCITGFVKAQQPICIAGDADASAFGDPGNLEAPLDGDAAADNLIAFDVGASI